MSSSAVTFGSFDGRTAMEHESDVIAVHADVYGDPVRGPDDPDAFPRRFRVWRRQPGFALAVAHSGDYLVGYACGMPLRTSTSWWKELTTPLPDDVTDEYPGRTFALTGLAVRAPWRRQGIARELYDLVLTGREEERATLIVDPHAAPAQEAFRAWGWRKIARTRAPDPHAPALDVLTLDLPSPT
jgi:ribosomal protein S18 acetylase RimI-like enzyme